MLQPGLRNAKSRVKVATPSLKPRARTAFTYQKLKYCTTLRYLKKQNLSLKPNTRQICYRF